MYVIGQFHCDWPIEFLSFDTALTDEQNFNRRHDTLNRMIEAAKMESQFDVHMQYAEMMGYQRPYLVFEYVPSKGNDWVDEESTPDYLKPKLRLAFFDPNQDYAPITKVR